MKRHKSVATPEPDKGDEATLETTGDEWSLGEELWQSQDEPELSEDDARTYRSAEAAEVSPPAAPAHALNAVTIGRYELLDILGRGGMGVVYRARDRELGRDVALKVMLAGMHASDKGRKRFLREARAVAKLRHAHIVQIFDIGTHDDNGFFTMELIEGPPLSRRMRASALDHKQAAAVVSKLARALAYAHDRGFVHRDVKPGNVLLDTSDAARDGALPVNDLGRPVLTDFGLVKDVAGDEETAALTRGGVVVGTPAYMAPEQLRGDIDAIGPHTDQYALGVVLWELLTGARPHGDATPAELVQKVLLEQPIELRAAGVPTPLRRISQKTLAHAPRERYVDCVALAEDLERFVAGEPVLAASPGPLWHVRRFVRRHRRTIAVACLIALTAGGALYARDEVADWQATRAERARQAAAEDRRVAMQGRIAALLAGGATPDQAGLAEADEVFTAFTHSEDNAETHALARAWVERGDWLRSRAVMASDEHARAARAAYATAFGLAQRESEQSAALLGLARLFRNANNWHGGREALATLARRSPAAMDRREAIDLRRDLALSERRIADAADLIDTASLTGERPESELLTRLARATRTGHSARMAVPWDVDRDGRPELAIATGMDNRVTIVDLQRANLPVRARYAVPALADQTPSPIGALHALSRSASQAPILLVTEGRRSKLVQLSDHLSGRVSDARLELVAPPVKGRLFGFASGDLDGDGAFEHYAALNRRIVSLAPRSDGTFAVENPMPPGRVIASKVRDLAIADVDGDGRLELMAATEEWNAYDIRAYHHGEDGLTLHARRRLGRATQVAIVRTPGEQLAAVIQEHNPSSILNPRYFGDDVPHGEPRGIHLLALTDGEWQNRLRLPFEPATRQARGRSMAQSRWNRSALFAGDLDGDGLDDLVASLQDTWTLVYHQRPDGSFIEMRIDGLTPLALHDIDGDGAAELIAYTADAAADVWVLGVGDDPLPALNRETATDRSEPADPAGDEPQPAPDGDRVVEPTRQSGLRDDWRRATDLAAMGLQRLASARFEQIALLASGTPTEARALYRAGVAMEATARELVPKHLSAQASFTEASALYRRSAAAASALAAKPLANELAARAWDAALRCDLLAPRYREALAAARARTSLPEPSAFAVETERKLAAILAASSIAFDFADDLDPRWRVHLPFDVRLDRRARGLRVRTAGHGPLLSLPLRRTAGPVRITLEADRERIDWGSVFFVALTPGLESPAPLTTDAESLQRSAKHDVLRWESRGGSGVFREFLHVLSFHQLELPDAEAPERRTRRLTWQYTPSERRTSAQAQFGEQIYRSVNNALQPDWNVPDTATLVIGGAGLSEALATSETLLRRLELSGYEIAETASEPLWSVHHHLAVERPDLALADLDQLDQNALSDRRSVAADVARATALAELARTRDANRVLADALARAPDLNGLLVPIFLHHLDIFEPSLRTALGRRYYAEFWHIVDDQIYVHRDDEVRGTAPLVAHLEGLETLPFDTFSNPLDVEAHLYLLALRGVAWRKSYRSVLGFRDLQRTLEFGRHLSALKLPELASIAREIRKVVGSARFELAAIFIERRQPDRAIDLLLEALAESTVPELYIDRLQIIEEFTPLHGHPRWPRTWRRATP